jgi:plasmid stabilization system protein ParE
VAYIVQFLPLARLEAIEARDWYEARSPGLGEAFVLEMDRLADRVAENPLAFPTMLADVRRARLRRFPYSLFFRIVGEECFVLACFHASRDPKRWRERV